MSPERPARNDRWTSSMYSAPSPAAASSWIAAPSGRASFAAARPIAAPPATQTRPPRPASARNRRRDGSWSPPSSCRFAAHRDSRSAVSHTARPAAMPSVMLPSRVTASATKPPSRAKTIRERGAGERATPKQSSQNEGRFAQA